ncbi:hypothetical protein LTR40_009846, partial [Exophiala xenobiotica]
KQTYMPRLQTESPFSQETCTELYACEPKLRPLQQTARARLLQSQKAWKAVSELPAWKT